MANILCFDIHQIDKTTFQTLYGMALPERKSKADRYAIKEDKIRCIIADALLQYTVKKELSLIDNIAIGYTTHGKPYLQNSDSFHYNISHSGRWVVMAYSNNQIGVDIEQINKNDNKGNLALRFFTDDEQEYVFEDGIYHAERFYEIWTGKESYIKYLGTGLSKSLKSFSVIKLRTNGLYNYTLEDEYSLSVFTTDKTHSIEKIELSQIT